jgi:hypothetical protein
LLGLGQGFALEDALASHVCWHEAQASMHVTNNELLGVHSYQSVADVHTISTLKAYDPSTTWMMVAGVLTPFAVLNFSANSAIVFELLRKWREPIRP